MSSIAGCQAPVRAPAELGWTRRTCSLVGRRDPFWKRGSVKCPLRIGLLPAGRRSTAGHRAWETSYSAQAAPRLRTLPS